MRSGAPLMVMTLVFAVGAACGADEPPRIEHQPIPCTVPDAPFAVCAAVSDDEAVSGVRVFFRAERARHFNMTEMTFGGLSYCATLPAPRKGKLRKIEYYVQAVDSAMHFERSPTFQILVQDGSECSFPPLVKDAERAAQIVVYATMKDQGKKLHGVFDRTRVTFVPTAK